MSRIIIRQPSYHLDRLMHTIPILAFRHLHHHYHKHHRGRYHHRPVDLDSVCCYSRILAWLLLGLLFRIHLRRLPSLTPSTVIHSFIHSFHPSICLVDSPCFQVLFVFGAFLFMRLPNFVRIFHLFSIASMLICSALKSSWGGISYIMLMSF